MRHARATFGYRTHTLAGGTNREAAGLPSVGPPSAIMNRLTLIAVFVLAAILAAVSAAAPAAAQATSQNGQAQSSVASGSAAGAAAGSATAPTQAPSTGVFCIEEMTADFCNVVTGPNTGGYGARGGSASTSGTGAGTSSASGAGGGISSASGAGGGTSSIPPCPSEPPFNELCD